MAVPRSSDWRATVRQLDAGYFTSTDTRLPADLTFTNDGHDDGFVIDTLLEGGISIDRGKAVSRFQPGDTFVGTGPAAHCTVRSHDVRVQAITLPRALLTAVAATDPGHLGSSWEFSSFVPVSGGARRWRDTAQLVDGLLADSEAGAAPLVIGPAARLLAATALAVFPNTAVAEPTSTDRHDARPQTVRRAASFIEAHADRDITLADIAAAASVTIRAVQLAFRRHLDTTPMEYLRRVRLDRAHRQLLAADPGRETVTAIAYRWGFPSPSRFAASYRAAYGIPPSQTLYGRPVTRSARPELT
ncbi:MAG: helix-turn-helix transcriptional regulator [Actinobacteria bacterium]|nr:helix-turn-helix transcriptional regulator [Actinomycetota bacterium]